MNSEVPDVTLVFKREKMRGFDNVLSRVLWGALLPLRPVYSPIIETKRDKRPWFVRFGEILGYDPTTVKALSLHTDRYYSWLRKYFVLFVIILIPASLTGIILTLGLITELFRSWMVALISPPTTSDIATLAIGIVALSISAGVTISFLLMYFTITFTLTSKLCHTLTSRGYTESICVIVTLELIADLQQDDILVRPENKKMLQTRLGYLAQETSLLALRFSSNDRAIQTRVKNHFGLMEAYIRERERWVITPTDTTLEDLRKDLYRLSDIYIVGNYGSFNWPEEPPSAPEPPVPGRIHRILRLLPRLAGILVPITLLAIIQQDPNQKLLGLLDPSVITLVLIAWFLLTIDATFNLGMINNLVELAKGIRELR